MNRHREHSLTTAVCASLLLHGGLFYGGLTVYVANLEATLTRPPTDAALLTAQADPADDAWQKIGRPTADGYAISDSPGERELRAPESDQDQPLLSRDPEGFGRVGDFPSPSLLPPGTGGAPAATFGLPLPTALPPAPLVPSRRPRVVAAAGATDDAGPLAMAAPAPEPRQFQVALQQPPAAPALALVAGTPGAPVPPADPAPQGESEIDPFSKLGSATFRPGKTDVQAGREVKLTRPRLGEAGRYDLLSMGGPELTLAIRTDAGGKVVNVDVYRSSGSNAVDQPCLVAAYDWWFEPPKGRDGRPRPDAFLFTINWRGV
ncbi:MAG TPA: energy transducer TonB [Tepidisphaeraceae bacterium]|nr:energy transducer TonB [Tepidisphaeraceae bacterium]